MKNTLLILAFILFSNMAHGSLKFSPYLGYSYTSEMEDYSSLGGLEFLYEFKNKLELALGISFARTKIINEGENISFGYSTASDKFVSEHPLYLGFRYNYHIDPDSFISPYIKTGILQTSLYYNNQYYFIDENKEDFEKHEFRAYGSYFYALGIAYTLKSYFVASEYKVRSFTYEYSKSDTLVGLLSEKDYNKKISSVSILFGYIFNSANRR